MFKKKYKGVPETIPLHVLYNCTDFDRNCQDGSIYTLLTAARIIKSKLYLCIKHHLCLTLPLFFPPVLFLFSLLFSVLFFAARLSFWLMTPNHICLHYFTSPCWNSYIWFIFNSISSGNVPSSDKSNHSNPETKKCTGTLKGEPVISCRVCAYACADVRVCVCVCVCVCVFPEVRDHLLILVRRENMFSREEVTYDWTPRLEHTCKGLSENLSTHTPPMHVLNTSRYSWCSCLIAHDWLGGGKKGRIER